MTPQDMKTLTALLMGLSGLATAVGSCNQAAQERLKADNKIYTVLAEGQQHQATDILELHKQIDELRGYLQAIRPAPMAVPAAPAAPVGQLSPLPRRFMVLPPLPPPAPAKPMPSLPAPSPPPVLRPLPRFEDIAAR